jgi:hypothetical protein
VLFGDFRNEHTVVGLAAILQENGENLPNSSDDGVLFLSMLKALLD